MLMVIRNRDKENIHLAMIYLCATIICIITLFVEQNKSHCCKVIAITMMIMTIIFSTTFFWWQWCAEKNIQQCRMYFISSPLILYLYLTIHLYLSVDLYVYTIYWAIQNQRDYALVGSGYNLILMQRFTLTWSCGWPLFCPSVPPLSLTFSYSDETLDILTLKYVKDCQQLLPYQRTE